MSLKRNAELCFKRVLQDAGIGAGESPAQQILTATENQGKTTSGHDIIIRAVSGPSVTPVARVIRLRVEILVRSNADKDQAEDTDPEVTHAANVKLVHAALEDNPTGLLALLNAAANTLEIDYSCQFIKPLGELQVNKPKDERVFMDAWGYEAISCEGRV